MATSPETVKQILELIEDAKICLKFFHPKSSALSKDEDNNDIVLNEDEYHSDIINEDGPEKALEDARDYILKEIKKHEESINLTIHDWKRREGKPSKPGVGRTTIYGIIASLERICSSHVDERFSPEIAQNWLIEFRKEIEHANSIKSEIEAFLALPNNPYASSKNDLSACSWNIYFLYFRDGKDKNEPLIGRGTLTINKENKVLLTNTSQDSSVDYNGRYIPDNDMSNGITTFNLESDEKGRRLHIKVHCMGRTQEIMVGQYCTYENSRIAMGDLLFEKIMPGERPKTKGVFSFVNNQDEFNLIHPTIKNFFSLKNYNYQQVFQNVDTLDKLQAKIDSHNRFDNKRSNFLEKSVPEAMVASSNSSMNDETLARVVDDLGKCFQGKVTFTTDKIFDENERPNPLANLKKLRTKRFFIIILTEVNKLSFSHIQLGLALAYCKHVIVVCKPDLISKTIKELRNNRLVKMIYFKDDFFKEWDEQDSSLKSDLISELKDNLPKNLDGYMDSSYSYVH
ncbi:MAG: hypothetical protein JNK00_00285 [Flavipsychrobacter sp.]|nr:hypothetical protein [Flavipsychrobacter sp.]